MPGEQGNIELLMRVPMVLLEGERFTLRVGKQTVATGIVTGVKEAEKDDNVDVFNSKLLRKMGLASRS